MGLHLFTHPLFPILPAPAFVEPAFVISTLQRGDQQQMSRVDPGAGVSRRKKTGGAGEQGALFRSGIGTGWRQQAALAFSPPRGSAWPPLPPLPLSGSRTARAGEGPPRAAEARLQMRHPAPQGLPSLPASPQCKTSCSQPKSCMKP